MSTPVKARIEDVVRQQLLARLPSTLDGDARRQCLLAASAIATAVELDQDEQELLDDLELDTTEQLAAAIASRRVERALLAGLREAGADPENTPRVFVLGDGDEPQIANTLQMLRERDTASVATRHSHAVVLATDRMFARLQRMLAGPATGRSDSVRFVEQLDGNGRDSHEAPGCAVEIVRTDLDLGAMVAQIESLWADGQSEGVRDAWVAGGTDAQPDRPHSVAPSMWPTRPSDSDGRRTHEDLVGALFHDKYRIIRLLGEGGFGGVFEAEDERGAGNRVAIKILSADATQSLAEHELFKQEARRVTRLSHPNIVDWKVFDQDEDGTPYFVMELIDGEEFEETLRRERRIEPGRTARILLQVLDALRAAHQVGEHESILHLDLKPSNLFRIPERNDRPEQIKVIDFGIGQYVGDREVQGKQILQTAPQSLDEPADLTTLTLRRSADSPPDPEGVTRSRGCTPEYASPEQCEHFLDEPGIRALDGRSDLYSLGVIAFEMLTGQLPFKPRSRLDVMRMHIDTAAPPVGSMGIRLPRRLVKFVDRCLQKDPGARWHSTGEAYDYLHALVHPPAWRAAAAIALPVIALSIALGSWALWNGSSATQIANLSTKTGQAVDAAPLHLGPDRAVLDLQLPGDQQQSAAGDPWRVVRALDGMPSETWAVTVLDAGTIRLTSRRPDVRDRLTERIELVQGDDARRSRAFDAVWVGPDAWRVDGLTIGAVAAHELDAMAFDPTDTELTVRIGGDARDDVREVFVRYNDAPPVQLTSSTNTSDQARYKMDLQDLLLPAGAATLTVGANDLAGRSWSRTFAIDVVADAARIEDLAIVDASASESPASWPAANRVGDTFVVTNRMEPALRIALPRPADVRWRVFLDGEQRPRLQGKRLGQASIAEPIAGLALLADGKPYSGRIEVSAAERDYVARREGSSRSTVSASLAFAYEDKIPTFDASWKVADSATALNTAHTAWTTDAEAAVVLSRTAAVPMLVEVSWWPDDSPERIESVRSESLSRLQAPAVTLPVQLEGDGLWRLRVRSYRFDTTARSPSQRADVTQTFAIVLDRSNPELLLSEHAPATRILQAASLEDLQPVACRWQQQAHESPVSLAWQLRRDGAPARTACSGNQEADDTGAAAAIDLSQALRDAPQLVDGGYTLQITAVDAAGNRSRTLQVPLAVSLTGPKVTLVEPATIGKWRANATTASWRVRAVVEDQNGVRQLQCELLTQSGESLAVPLAAEQGSSGVRQSMLGEVQLPHTLSESRVRLRFAGEDACGTRTSWTSDPFELPVIEAAAPDRVRVARGDLALEPMRLVRGNRGFEYLFGGRGDAIENPSFTAAGLEPFNKNPRRSRARSWQVAIRPGDIADFYLDEREVSVAQFAAFLRDPGGYENPAHWITADSVIKDRVAADQGQPQRRVALLQRLEREDANRAVGDISWHEAAAYAHWAHKRLPTWLEWEFAVRGGARYRTWSGQGTDRSPDDVLGGSPGLRGAAEWSPGSRLADLGSGLSEWTFTSLSGSPRAQLYPRNLARNDPAALLAPDPSGSRYWVVGGNYRQPRVDFATADHRRAEFRAPTIGFRCALSRDRLQQRMGQTQTDSVIFLEDQ